MTCSNSDCSESLFGLVYDCLEVAKLTDVNFYSELIMLRHEHLVSGFCPKRFTLELKEWCEANRAHILNRDETVLAKNYKLLYSRAKFPKSTMVKIWQFLENVLNDKPLCMSCN